MQATTSFLLELLPIAWRTRSGAVPVQRSVDLVIPGWFELASRASCRLDSFSARLAFFIDPTMDSMTR